MAAYLYLRVPRGHLQILYWALLRPCCSAGTWLRWEEMRLRDLLESKP
jgi:hypothetical protein